MKFVKFYGQVGQWIYDNVIMPVWNFIKGCFDWILAIFKTAFSVIEGIFTTLIGILLAPFQILWETVQGVFNRYKTSIRWNF